MSAVFWSLRSLSHVSDWVVHQWWLHMTYFVTNQEVSAVTCVCMIVYLFIVWHTHTDTNHSRLLPSQAWGLHTRQANSGTFQSQQQWTNSTKWLEWLSVAHICRIIGSFGVHRTYSRASLKDSEKQQQPFSGQTTIAWLMRAIL